MSHSAMSCAMLKNFHLRLIGNSDNIHWVYNFKMFICFSRISGIEIARLTNVSKLYRCSLLFYAVISWLVNVIGNILCCFLVYEERIRPKSNYLTVTNATADNKGDDFVSAGTVVIELILSSLLTTGVHGWLIVKSQHEDWAVLWNQLERATITEKDRQSSLRCQMKRMAFVGCAILFAVIYCSLI